MIETVSLALDELQGALVSFLATLPQLIVAVIVFGIVWAMSRFVRNRVVSVMGRFESTEPLSVLFGRITRALVIGVGLLFTLTIALPSFEPSELISILGIGGVAVGFAFRDIFENFLAGILILFTQPFGLGDEIAVNGYEGRVEDIQIRATYLKTYDGRLVVIPNSELFVNSVTVDTAYDRRRNEYDVGIGYEDDIARAQEIMLDVMRATDGVLDTPAPDTIMVEMGDSAIVLRVRWWSRPNRAEVLRVQNRVLRDIKNRLTDEGFNIPFPIRTVMFYDQSQPTT